MIVVKVNAEFESTTFLSLMQLCNAEIMFDKNKFSESFYGMYHLYVLKYTDPSIP